MGAAARKGPPMGQGATACEDHERVKKGDQLKCATVQLMVTEVVDDNNLIRDETIRDSKAFRHMSRIFKLVSATGDRVQKS